MLRADLTSAAEAKDLATIYGPQAASVINASAETLFRRQLSAADAPNAVALQCLAAAELVRYFGARATQVVERAADVLVSNSGSGRDQTVGWGLAPSATDKRCSGPGMFDAFGDGTCNPASTKYAFQTGLALTCLARAYGLTRKQTYLAVAKEVIKSSWGNGMQPPNCGNCFYYWYSDHQNDAGRYVGNTNALFGMGLAATHAVASEPRLLERIQQIANAERAEIAAGNMGYAGIADKQYLANPSKERLRIENHLPYLAKALLEIGKTLNDKSVIADSVSVMKAWINCPDEICGRKSCKEWAGDPSRCDNVQLASPCFLRKYDVLLEQRCNQHVQRLAKFDAYVLWAVLSGAR